MGRKIHAPPESSYRQSSYPQSDGARGHRDTMSTDVPKTKSRRRLLARAALVFGGVVLALFLGEILVRYLGQAPELKAIQLGSDSCAYKRSTNPLLGFELKADYRNDAPDLIQSYERTNSYGQRDKERTREKPAGVRRVLLLGDSVVEGYGLREPETISRQLENLYLDGTTEVLNFGVSAYCTRAEIELLEVKGLQFEPDVVVLVFVENDFDNFNREAFPLGGTIERPAIAEKLFVRSHLFRLACVRWNLFHFGAEMDPVQWNQDAIGDNNVTDGLQRFRQLADRYGFRPLIPIWPRFFDDRIDDVPKMPGNDSQLVIEQLAAIHGIPSVRLSEFFRQHVSALSGDVNPRLRYTSGDQLHPSAEGCQVAAEALKRILDDLDSGSLPKKIEPSSQSLEDAAAVAKALGAEKPSYVRVHNRLGTELLKAGKLEEAVREFKQAIEEDPQHAGTHNNLGVAYERLERPEAEDQFRQAIQLDPGFAQAHFNLARILLKKRQSAEAVGELQETLRIDPNHVGALNKLGVEVGKRKEFAQAQSLLERAIEIDPDYSDAHNNLGVIYAAQRRWQEAAVQFRETLRINPDHARARANLSRIESR